MFLILILYYSSLKVDETTVNLTGDLLETLEPVGRTGKFIDRREVSARFPLVEGRYCVVPSTFRPGEEGDFLLRMYVEKNWKTANVLVHTDGFCGLCGGTLAGKQVLAEGEGEEVKCQECHSR